MDSESLFQGDPPSGPPVSVIEEAIPGRGGLLLANITGASDPVILVDHRVRLLVQCAAEYSGDVAGAAAHAERIAGLDTGAVKVLELNMDDDDLFDLGPALAVALPRMATVRASGETVLVNCAAGRSRSASVVLAHLMTHASVDGGAPRSFRGAWAALRSARPFAYPNLGFTVQLLAREPAAAPSLPPDALRLHYGFRLLFDSDAEGLGWVEGKLAAVRSRLSLQGGGALGVAEE